MFEKTLLTKSYFNNIANSRPETLQKHNPTVYVSLQILKISKNIFCLKNFLQVPLAGLYSVKTYLQNTSKTLPKISNLCSLYAENYLLNRNYTHPRILRKF